jgi:lipopolysaccharide transport system ATP-binding protein
MSAPAISAKNLSKQYTLGERWAHDTFRDHLVRNLQRVTRGRHEGPRHETIWALRDVSFEVAHGDVIGIIGSNGAGKSTLLKILTRITPPSSGHAEIRGRVGSLLEVGTGFFHPELTGRENLYLSGAILGMKKNEIDRKRDDIVAFAGVERFIDTPVKRYSTGMNLRLAFAVAAHLDQEILFVDEVLAVGDAEFQRKCLGKMGQISREGRTIIFVSHSMAAITHLCSRALWLKAGRVAADGPSAEVVTAYLASGLVARSVWRNSELDRSTDTGLRLTGARVLSAEDEPTALIGFRSPFKIEIAYEVLRPLRDPSIIARVVDSIGTNLWTAYDTEPGRWSGGSVREPGRYVSVCAVPPHLLAPGPYRVDLGARTPEGILCEHDAALTFEISEVGYAVPPGATPRGVIAPRLEWEVRRVGRVEGAAPETAPLGSGRI